MLDDELKRIDGLISKLASAPHIDHMALYKNNQNIRNNAIEKMFEEGISWGEAMGFHRILNQSEDLFRAELKSIDNNIVAQVDIIEHYLPLWFSLGEFPPPYYALRIAIILRKANEIRRERDFLFSYLINFRSKYGSSRTDEKLIERTLKLGVTLPPIR